MHPELKGIIYCFWFVDNKTVWLPYIGYSLLTLEERIIWHQMKPINEKVKKYDFKNCIRDVLEVVSTTTYKEIVDFPTLVKTLLEREAYWIDSLDSIENGLNMKTGNASDKLVNAQVLRNPYFCKECKWRFSSRQDLDEHILPSIPIPKNKEFFCLKKRCRLPFENVDQVFLHMELDHPWKVFHCTIKECNECFEFRKDLYEHLEIVHSETFNKLY